MILINKTFISFYVFSNLFGLCCYIFTISKEDKLKPNLTLTKDDLRDSILMETLQQNDSRILKYIQRYHLRPPPFPKGQIKLTFKHEERMKKKRHSKNMFKMIKKLFKNKRNGFFIEAGANDGEFLSNTLDLERKLGWTGLLVEADPNLIPDLIHTKRNAWISNLCLSITPFPIQMEMKRTNRTNGISHLAQIGAGMLGDVPGAKDWSSFQVQCFPLYSILSALGVTSSVDYLSLDIEGAEIEMLNTIPWDAVLIKVISIEVHNGRLKPTKAFMSKKGYKYIKRVIDYATQDCVFVHSSMKIM